MQIVTFSERRPALALSDYLRTLGIPNRVEQVSDGFAVILENAADAPKAVEETHQFIAHPEDPRYLQASWESGQSPKESVYAEPSDNGTAWWRRAGPGTRGIALVCVLVYIGLAVDFDKVVGLLAFPNAISVAAVNGQWWRLLTPAFMHFGLLHIVFNLLWWWELGGIVERVHSTIRLLAVSLVVALVSNAAQSLTYGADFGGLSAVIYGLMGYLWLYPVTDPGAPYRLRGGIVAFLLGWLVIGYTGLLDVLFGVHVSNNGHLAGLVTGAVLGLLLGWVNYRQPPRPE
ncbi:MAG TPA: rhomboid family intramembrane serine protease GlpG [Moraxellaceae bacterium]|nr:rhomboid family intramembrane serine protease GlpG [Moraxellaceae bacterium]